MDRKAALVGCSTGQWIRTSGISPLRLNARVPRETMLVVEQKNHLDEDMESQMITRPGHHQLPKASWTRVRIAAGPHADALCFLEGGG